jgi:hypothetical protein
MPGLLQGEVKCSFLVFGKIIISIFLNLFYFVMELRERLYRSDDISSSQAIEGGRLYVGDSGFGFVVVDSVIYLCILLFKTHL